MKTIGLLGGMSWESTELYYRLINEETRRLLGGLHSAPIAMVSVDFQEIEQLQEQGDWDAAARLLSEEARRVEAAGAELLLICTNTMHKVADQVADAIGIPLLHIADATAVRVQESGIGTVGLLGTRFTMEQQFYKGRLQEQGLTVVVPDTDDRNLVHRTIYDELCLGRVNPESRREFLRIIEALRENGAEAVIEGCTEIGLLVGQEHTSVPLFDTTRIHAHRAVAEALKQGPLTTSPAPVSE
jgi:aspartate racemase